MTPTNYGEHSVRPRATVDSIAYPVKRSTDAGQGINLADVRAEVLNLLGHDAPNVEPHKIDSNVLKAPPTLTPEQLRLVRERIEQLDMEKERFVATQDFERATRCRDEADALKRLLAWYEWFNGSA